MTTIVSDSSSPQDDGSMPTATLALPYVATGTRRLPPLCWSSDETLVLIDAYKDKWYALHRGNLRANHWQEVADDVASRFQASPPKTAVQCRHKMEKLRKRYRAEIQRAAAHGGVRRFSSAWVHFQSMYAMERGPNNLPFPPSSDDEENRDNKKDIKRINDLYSNSHKATIENQDPAGNGSAAGFRIKIPGMVTPAPAKVYGRFNKIGYQIQNRHHPDPRLPNLIATSAGKRVTEILKKNKAEAGVGEVVEAIQALGEGFLRMEKMKIDMARQVEEMRMAMELRRTEMMLESQKRIIEAFSEAVLKPTAKKVKRMTPPECSNGAGHAS